MSLIIGNGMCLSYFETEIKCPICEQIFDASKKMDAAKIPIFNMRCPNCKGKITISIPIFGGELKYWETECPKTVKRLMTKTLNRVNGMAVKPNILDHNSYEDPEMPIPA